MDIEVPMGELVVTGEEVNIACHAVGSCVAVILYDSKLKIAGMIHAMLPYAPNPSTSLAFARHRSLGVNSIEGSSVSQGAQPDAKYVDTAIDSALEKMRTLGAERIDIEAKLVGGANMFGLSSPDIGRENVLSAKRKLKEAGIKLIGESTGGSIGRSVEFSVVTSIVTVKISF